MRIAALLLALTSTFVLADESNCSVMLTDTGEQKINIIKIVREYTSLGLKDAKDLVEAPKPTQVRDGLSRADAEALVAALVAKGATAEVREKGEHPLPQSPRLKKAAVGVTFDVRLESYGENKINVIKIVRDRTGLGLAETKKLVESAPVVVSAGQSRLLADSMVKDLIAVGAKASLAASSPR